VALNVKWVDRVGAAASRPRTFAQEKQEKHVAAPYVTRAAFDPERPQTLVVCCSDGRYHGPIEEFVRAQVSERPDLFAIPGGPATIDAWASSFDHARVFDSSLELLFKSHALQSAWLIAHQGCAFYRHRHGEQADAVTRARQFTDLQRARALLLERHPKLEVHLVYATLAGATARVEFTELDAELLASRGGP
jgi:hypothetical protein